MAKKPNAPKPQPLSANAQAMLLLADAVHDRPKDPPFMVAPKDAEELDKYASGPLVEFNKTMVDGDKVACRTTAAGRELAATLKPTNGATDGATEETEIESEFEIEDGIPIPTLKRGGRQGPARVYPFASMGVGASFFIPKTGDNEKPAKRIASVVSNATKQMAPKHFKVQAVVDPKKGEGARIWRMPDFTPDELAEREKQSAANAAKKAAKAAEQPAA